MVKDARVRITPPAEDEPIMSGIKVAGAKAVLMAYLLSKRVWCVETEWHTTTQNM